MMKGNDSVPPARQGIRALFLSDHLGHADGAVHGASTYFLNVLPTLQQHVAHLSVAFLRDRHAVAAELEAQGVHPIFFDRGKWDVRAVSDVQALMRREQVELIHAAGMKGILAAKMVARRSGIPLIMHLHDANPVSAVIRRLQVVSRHVPAACICISEAVAQYARSALGVPQSTITVLPNPLPDDAFAPIEAPAWSELGLTEMADASAVIGVIGRLSDEKGHEQLIQAAAPWFAQHPQARLLVVGDGPLRAALTQQVNERGLAQNIYFLGHRSDVRRIIAGLDTVVVPSHKEGLGYVALEAMAAGCPVVATAVGGLPEVIEHEVSGMLVPDGDIKALFTQVDHVIDDPGLAQQLREGGQQRARSYALKPHIDQLIKLYSGVLGS